jgi:hypothetical protein
MGFTKAPGSLWDKILFINNCQGYAWSWPENKPCTEQAIEGVPRGLVIRESDYKGEVSEKLHFLLTDDDGTVYCLRSGIDTLFSRGLLLGLQVSLAEKIDRPIIVAPRVSDRDEKVIFCNLYAGGQKVRYEWDRDIDCHDLALELAAKYFPDIPFRKDEPSPPTGGANPATGEVNFKDLIAKNNADLKRLQLPQAEAVNICFSRYGKKSRQLLSDAELIDFVNHVDSLVKKAIDKTDSTLAKDDIPF